MLVLSRKRGQEIVIGENLRLTILSISENRVSLGFIAPTNVSIQRKEIACKPGERTALTAASRLCRRMKRARAQPRSVGGGQSHSDVPKIERPS